MTFLWAIIIVMAIALAAEIFALVGLAITIRGSSQRLLATKQELAQSLQRSKTIVQELSRSLRPQAEIVHRQGAEIASTLTARGHFLKVTTEDMQRRVQRVRIRFQTDGKHAVEQLEEGKRAIQDTGRVLSAVSAAIWLLRKVA